MEFKCIVINGTIKERRLQVRDIAKWLSGTGDLILDHEPDKTYKVIRTVSDVNLRLDQITDEFNITFEAEPYQYGTFKSISVDNPTAYVFTNGGNATAETIIFITGTGDVTVTCGEQSFTLTGMTEKLNLDSKRMLVYSDLIVNNISKHTGDFIKLQPGDNTITVVGTVSNITVKYYDTYF